VNNSTQSDSGARAHGTPGSDPAKSFETQIARAEFDQLADDYHRQHEENVAITGESPEYFSEYKISDLSSYLNRANLPATNILDFGSGIGNSIPHFRKYFPGSSLSCADVSTRSMEISRSRFPGHENYVLIDDGRLPLESGSQDLVFSACVFHHIPHSEHQLWLSELRRVTRKGGVLAIYEHNPLNPLTVRAVNTCPLDANAHLIFARQMRQRVKASGWVQSRTDYRLFFPAFLAKLRPMEQHLGWLGLGAQYRLLARQTT
jgi:SAM-dependent methyltransferase